MEGADEMKDEKLRSDWDALTAEEQEEVIEAFKCSFEAVKRAAIILTETAIKVMPELLNADTSDLKGSDSGKEGVL